MNRIKQLKTYHKQERILLKIIQYPFIIKIINQVGTEGTHCSIIKAINYNSTAHNILNSEKLNAL